MTSTPVPAGDRFRLLAGYLAGRPIGIAQAQTGELASTDGQFIFVSAGGSTDEQRLEVLVQSALLGGGSLDRPALRAVGPRPSVIRRYLALEGRRVLAELANELPLAAAVHGAGEPSTTDRDESVAMARGRAEVPEPPPWFGTIRPGRVVADRSAVAARPTESQLGVDLDALHAAASEDGEDGEDSGGEDDEDDGSASLILKLFEGPLGSSAIGDLLRKLLGSSRSRSNQAGAGMRVGSIMRGGSAGPNARPLPTRLRLAGDPAAASLPGVREGLYPEWDVHGQRYRPDWCRVVVAPLTVEADVAAAAVTPDDVLRRRLSRVGLGPKVLRARPDGDDLDLEALIDFFVDVRSGFSPPDGVYVNRRKLARDLGVLVLVDASGSATDVDGEGRSVHEHQCRAAATLAMTLEDLGDRVAVHAFRSHGRRAVHLLEIKGFEQRFGAVSRARLNRLQPSGYTRLGAGVRGAGDILKEQAGTPNRLLVVLSDGFPYDIGYEGRYGEADVARALEELRGDGVGCLCISIGSEAFDDSLRRVFGEANYAYAPTLASLSPRMDELFLASLRHLAAPRQRASSCV